MNRDRSPFENVEKVEVELRTCIICEEEKNVNEFYSYKKIRYNQCKKCIYAKKARERYEETLKIPKYYKELEKFVLYVKRRNYMVGHSDIFRLIDMFDKVFPSANVPTGDNEYVFNKIFFRLAKQYDKYRNIIITDGVR